MREWVIERLFSLIELPVEVWYFGMWMSQQVMQSY
jgi:hypothetical protein